MSHGHSHHVSSGPAAVPLFRSEDMIYIRLLMTDEACYDTVKSIGQLAKLHVVDVNK